MATWASGLVLGLMAALADDLAAPLRSAVSAVYVGLLAGFGCVWLTHAVRDGTFRAALPDYASAALALLAIAAASAMVTLVLVAMLGETITADKLSTGAAIGTGVVLVAYRLSQVTGLRRT